MFQGRLLQWAALPTPLSALTSIAALITHYVTPPLQIKAPILTLMIVNMLSCTAAILRGSFPRRGLNSPRHCTSTQEETKLLLRGASRAALSRVSPQHQVLRAQTSVDPSGLWKEIQALFVYAQDYGIWGITEFEILCFYLFSGHSAHYWDSPFVALTSVLLFVY